jgi:PAS domain S-box-containing protein
MNRDDQGIALFRIIVESSDDAILTKTLHGVVTSWNPGAERMFGYGSADMIGEHITKIFPPERLDEEAEFLRRLARGEHINHYETVRVRKDGRLVDVSVSLSPLRDPDGHIIGVVKIARDITDRRRAEAEAAQQREWFRVTLGSIGDAVIATNLEARVIFMNHRAEALTGWRQEDATQRLLTDVFDIVNEQTRGPAENPVSRVLREGMTVGLANSTVLICRDGSEVPIDDSAAPIRELNGNVVGVVLVFHDIGDRRRADAERARLLAAEQTARLEAERANRAKDEFLAMLSHELRNPLGAIVGAVNVLERVDNQDDAAIKARQVIDRQAQHLGHLVDDLLDVGRVTTGKVVLDRRPINLAAVAGRVLSTWTEAASAYPHRVETEFADVWIDADETRIEQIVTNLLSNAFKYTPPEGRIEVTTRREGADAVFTVSDNGIGIPADLLPHVFDLFIQGDRHLERAHGGLGVGLSVARRLVELHGGSLSAASPGRGRGAVFTLRMHALEDAEVTLAAPPNEPRLATVPRRILLVEDNADSREMLRLVLLNLGHEVHEAADGAAGLDAARALEPDVVLLDVGLPGLDGYQIARRIRAGGGRQPILIALTGYGFPADEKRARDAGFDLHLVKPVNVGRLVRMLNSLHVDDRP